MVDERFTISGPPPEGFTILYNQSAQTLIEMHSTPVRCYLALCIMSDESGQTFMTRETLGEKMGGVSVDTVDRAVRALEEVGLLKVDRHGPGRGLSNNYSLKRPQTGPEKAANENEKRPQTGPEKAAPAMRHQQETQQEENRTAPLPPTGERKTGSIDSITQDSQIKNNPGTIPEGHEPRGGNRVPNSNGRPQSELENPWWQENGRQKRFDFFLENYPKMSPVVEAKVEMRLALEDKIDDPDFMNRVWHGLQWWKRKWTAEETEERYIPNMGKWFARRQWEEANVNPGAMVNSGEKAE